MTHKSIGRNASSFRAKRGIRLYLVLGTIACAALPLFASSAAIGKEPKRSPIRGITMVEFYSSNVELADRFYATVLGAQNLPEECQWGNISQVAGGSEIRLHSLCSDQTLKLMKPDQASPATLLHEIIFATEDVKSMKKYLRAKRIEILKPSGARYFAVMDPEGHRIGFMQSEPSSNPSAKAGQRLIHAGFIVRNQTAMDHFYKDILGFRPYWHGGMKDDETSWISLQVPEGTDWVEFMVNVPENADQHLRGVMNHIAIGVVDIQAEREQLVKNGVHLTEEPKLGRDGKWQLNLYDPDQTRIEFMEFTPKEKPCCSEYTGPHPKP
jgi:catechol 2,3-dioxygenase-like lactoylglutathione lyase family enzyme